MGLKGNFFFTKHDVKFDITFRMSHIIGKNNKISGVNPPENLILSGDADFEQKIPFVVIEDTDRYSSNEDEYYSNLMDYYQLKGKITQEDLDDALLEMERQYPEGGNFQQ